MFLRITRIKAANKIKNEIYIMPIIESALGIINAYEIATASQNVCALAIGLGRLHCRYWNTTNAGRKRKFFCKINDL